MASESKQEYPAFDKDDDLCVRTIRVMAADIVQKSNSGHPGAPMGMAPVAHILWSRFLNGNPNNSKWINRDRFVLSNGHACALQYSMLHLTGYNVKLDDLRNFRQLGSITPGHPELGVTDGVEVTTGPLGQGLAQAVGLAIASKHLGGVFNKEGFDLFNHKIYVFCGDGCIQEGVSSEASSLAGHLKLNNLIIIYDDNHISIDGNTKLSFTEDVGKRYEAYGFDVFEILNGNTDYNSIINTLNDAINKQNVNNKPILIKLKTTIGFGSLLEDTHKVHGSPLGDEKLKDYKSKMGFDINKNMYDDNVIESSVYNKYQNTFLKRGLNKNDSWNKLFSNYKLKYDKESKLLVRMISGELPNDWKNQLIKFDENSKEDATRNINSLVLNNVCNSIFEVIGGSADLTPSTKTLIKNSYDFQGFNNQYNGRYLRFGVREFGMFAIGNGISAYGCNLIPFTSTFLNFLTYGWGAVRLGALSHLRHLYIMTHDSIFLGEDGPTHQPIEVLPLVRCTPNLILFRPCDGNEINAAWIAGIENNHHGGTVVCLSRQKVKNISKYTSIDNALNKGAYCVLNGTNDESKDNNNTIDGVIISTGSEVGLCFDAALILKNESNLTIRVISAPCLDIFDKQDINYKKSILLENKVILSVEASSKLGWTKYSHNQIGMDTFGASGPLKIVGDHFGFSPKKIADTMLKTIEKWKGKQIPSVPALWD